MRPGFVVLLLLLTGGCSFPFGSDPDSVELRVFNDSDYLYEKVTVNGVAFGNIASGKFSGYEVVEGAYHYGAIRLEIGGTQFGLQPIDFVGETPLEAGRYTYSVSADVQTRRLELTFYEGDAWRPPSRGLFLND